MTAIKTPIFEYQRNRLAWLECDHYVPHLVCLVRTDDGRELPATYEDGTWLDERGRAVENVREWQPQAVESVYI